MAGRDVQLSLFPSWSLSLPYPASPLPPLVLLCDTPQQHHTLVAQAPEMVRVPLEELVLQIHLLGLGPAGQFLERVLEPPPKASVEGALAQLQALGALTAQQQLTPLGRVLLVC